MYTHTYTCVWGRVCLYVYMYILYIKKKHFAHSFTETSQPEPHLLPHSSRYISRQEICDVAHGLLLTTAGVQHDGPQRHPRQEVGVGVHLFKRPKQRLDTLDALGLKMVIVIVVRTTVRITMCFAVRTTVRITISALLEERLCE